ncbi:hypothetical protein VaNZ11_008776 [Volvox africanus]|uniref:Nucleoporin Nup133/Nup155-like N-terminal domain-containing protein n=1 Tax=Volvox africanus TaxID=51714 RepID=A0ABQ5S6U9_9CHLO|nr:hypothetical protein VaNZ11_008776 [Volvox africanus]
MAAAPVWQRDVAGGGSRGGGDQTGSLGMPIKRFEDVDQITKTFSHITDVSMEFRRESDLFDLLQSTSKEDTYQQHFQGWPTLLRPLSGAILELPTMVQEKYNSCQTMCFIGLFPQIRRAWASVDNSLFLWRYDKTSDVPVEYSGEDQAITAVCLTEPKPGVFLPAIRYIIVLCTAAEIVMLGVCPSRRGNTGEDWEGVPEDIILQPLPLYSISADNVLFTSCVAGPAGRIFLGGADGCVYELSYHASESWCQKRMYKSRLEWHFRSILPSMPAFIPTFGNWATSAIAQLTVDKERHILYSLNVASGIKVFDLGPVGEAPAKLVAEVSNVYAAAAGAVGGKELFRGAAADRKAASIKYITPITTSESSGLHLMAVTADGRRIYFSTHTLSKYGTYNLHGSARGISMMAKAPPVAVASATTSGALAAGSAVACREPAFYRRPETLAAVFARAALPHSAGARGATGDLSRSAALELLGAHYSAGCLLLSESAGGAGSGGATKFLMASRNTTVPTPTVNTHTIGIGGSTSSHVPGGLRESVTELDNIVPGETTALEATPWRPVLGPEVLSDRAGPGSNELISAVWWPPPRFIVMSTAGVMELEKRRPVELLMQILERSTSDQLRSFFQAYGAAEAAAMCYQIATSGPPGALVAGPGASRGSLGGAIGCAPCSSSLGGGGVSALAARGAAAALDNPLLVGEARMPEDAALEGGYPHNGSNLSNALAGGGANGMYMGRAVDPNPGPYWSTGHRGLCLYISRLLAPVYDKKIVVAVRGKPAAVTGIQVLKCGFSERTLGVLEDRLNALGHYLEASLTKRQQRGYAARTFAAVTSSGAYGAGGAGASGAAPMPAGGGAPGVGYGAAAAGGGLFGFGAGMAAGGADDPTVVVHKRRRLEHAAQQEDEMVQRIRALVFRVAEACRLLALLSAHNLGRLALREFGSGTLEMAKLANMTLRDLVQEPDGQDMASRLMGGLVNEQMDASMAGAWTAASRGVASLGPGAAGGVAASSSASVDAVAATLQAAAPSYFRQEDRKYYQASAVLRNAEAVPPGPERDAIVKQAITLLLSVPTVVSLEALTKELVRFRYFEGIVAVSLAVAAARDPEGKALRAELGTACELARGERRSAYNYILQTLGSLLLDNTIGGGVDVPPLTSAERAEAKSAMLKAALASTDKFFLDELYGFVISNCKAADELLSRDAPGLESYLAREGGLVPPGSVTDPADPATAIVAAAAAALNAGVLIGPLTKTQVALLELLCSMLVRKGRFLDAALVYGALGCRRSGSGADLSVSLDSRVAAMQSAVLHARSAGASALVSRLDSDAKVFGFQDAIVKRLQERQTSMGGGAGRHAGGSAGAMEGGSQAAGPGAAAGTALEPERALAELSGAPLDLSELYNAYAQPFGLWDICLQMIRFAGGCGNGDPPAVVRTLWDHELLRAHGSCRSDSPVGRLERACDAASNLGSSLYPDSLTLPLMHIAWRLESLAAGLWPRRGANGDGGAAATVTALGEAADRSSELIVQALMTAAGGSGGAVRQVYEALLSHSRGNLVAVGTMDPQLSTPAMRVQLLRSAAAACAAAILDVRSAALAPVGVGAAAAPMAGVLAPGVGVAREAGSLADAADRFALEARRLGYSECEGIARRLEAVRTQAEALR